MNDYVIAVGDIFHDGADDESLDLMFAFMAIRPELKFRVTTKNIDRMEKYMNTFGGHIDGTFPEGVYLTMEYLDWQSRDDIATYAPPGSTLPEDPEWPLTNVIIETF